MPMNDGIKTTSFEISFKEEDGKVYLFKKSTTERLDLLGHTGEWESEAMLRSPMFKKMQEELGDNWKEQIRNDEMWDIVTGKLFRHGVLYAEKKKGEQMTLVNAA